MKQLAVVCCRKITDAGISMVISHCNQLRVLNLEYLEYITGMCALCEDPEPRLCFITMVYDILTAGSSLITKAHTWTIFVSWYNSAHNFISFSLILHCIACCSQIHHIVIIHIFIELGSDPLCFCQSLKCIFYWPSSINYPMQNLIQNSFIVIFFLHF